MLIFGHRGAPGFPRHGENTIKSFEKALAAGADGVEFDIRRCGDGRLVVIHDETVDRTTNGRGRVATLTYEELVEFDAGDGERIPLLSEVLDRFGQRCILNIEIKDSGLGTDLKKLMGTRSITHNVIVSAFNWLELDSLRGAVPIALLATGTRGLVSTAREMGAIAIHPRHDIAMFVMHEAREAKLRTHVWTVNEPPQISAFRAFGVDGIFSDFPERCTTPAS